MKTPRRIVLVSALALLGAQLGACNASGTRISRNGMTPDATRFVQPQVDGAKAAKELGERRREYERELRCAQSQLAHVQAVMQNLDDPQLVTANQILISRIEQFTDDVRTLTWKEQEAINAQSAESFKDFSMSLVEAPQPLPKPSESCKSICDQLTSRYAQLQNEIRRLGGDIFLGQLQEREVGELNAIAVRDQATYHSEKERLMEESLETSWRMHLASIAVQNGSKLDLTPLLAAPESQVGQQESLAASQ